MSSALTSILLHAGEDHSSESEGLLAIVQDPTFHAPAIVAIGAAVGLSIAFYTGDEIRGYELPRQYLMAAGAVAAGLIELLAHLLIA